MPQRGFSFHCSPQAAPGSAAGGAIAEWLTDRRQPRNRVLACVNDLPVLCDDRDLDRARLVVIAPRADLPLARGRACPSDDPLRVLHPDPGGDLGAVAAATPATHRGASRAEYSRSGRVVATRSRIEAVWLP